MSSPSAPDKVKALFTGAVMTPELAPESTLQEERNLCPQSGLSPPGVNMNTPWWEGAGAPHPSQLSMWRKSFWTKTAHPNLPSTYPEPTLHGAAGTHIPPGKRHRTLALSQQH